MTFTRTASLDRTILSHITLGPQQYIVEIEKWMDGGGLSFGLEFPTVIKRLFPNRVFEHCLDWCSGPGTIGFEIMSFDLCDRLTLMDMNGEVLRTAKKIAEKNNIQDRVKTIPSFTCALLPKVGYDLIVSNPPHFSDLKGMSWVNNEWLSITPDFRRRAEDKGWKIHEDFFNNIASRLNKDGVIILQENAQASSINDFKDMIERNGLKIVDSFTLQISLVYYIVITHV